MILRFDSFPTPLGEMTVAATDTGAICLLDFSDCGQRSERLLSRRFGSFERATTQNPQGIGDRMADYFTGQNPAACFLGLELDTGGTDFQKTVWRALSQIPYGETISYSQLAERISAPRAVRAAGSANGCNPVAIVVPCHRVIARNGKLAGYAGGVERKRLLLRHEQSGSEFTLRPGPWPSSN